MTGSVGVVLVTSAFRAKDLVADITLPACDLAGFAACVLVLALVAIRARVVTVSCAGSEMLLEAILRDEGTVARVTPRHLVLVKSVCPGEDLSEDMRAGYLVPVIIVMEEESRTGMTLAGETDHLTPGCRTLSDVCYYSRFTFLQAIS